MATPMADPVLSLPPAIVAPATVVLFLLPPPTTESSPVAVDSLPIAIALSPDATGDVNGETGFS